MKKKSFVFILLCLATITLFSGCVANAKNTVPIEENASPGLYVQREDAVPQKSLPSQTDSNKNTILSYEKTVNLDPQNPIDIYTDNAGIEYRFDKEGNLQGIIDPNTEPYLNDKESISNEDAIKLAKKYGNNLYGAGFSEFSFETCIQKTFGYFYVSFSKRYGEDAFILGPTISFTLTEYGELYSSTNLNSTLYSAFDESILSGITKSSVEKQVAISMNEQFKDSLVNYEINKIQLICEDALTFLQIPVAAEFKTHEEIVTIKLDLAKFND